MDDVIPAPSDVDPITFLQVEMEPNQEFGLGSGIIFAPAPTNLNELQKDTTGSELSEVKITPVVISDHQIDNSQADITTLTSSGGGDDTVEETYNYIDTIQIKIDNRKHVCSVCQYKFKRMDHLKRHMMTHTMQEVIQAQATQQGESSESTTQLLKGDVTLADDERRFTCTVCHYKFKRADHLKRHMTRSHPEELALIAAKELAKARDVSKGATKESQGPEIKKVKERRFVCVICDYKFTRKDHLNRHMNVHTDQIVISKEAESVNDIVGYNRPEEEVLWWTNMRRFCCRVCEAKFKSAEDLKRHMAKHSNNAVSVSLDSNTEEDIDSSVSLEETIKSEPPAELAVNDEIDNETVSNYASSTNNIELTQKRTKNDKEDDDQRHFVCNVCGYRFKRRYHLMRHMIKHTEDRLVSYGLAGGGKKKKAEEDKQNVDEEGVEKVDVKPSLGPIIFKCNICDVEFRQPFRLKSHMARHSDERLYACPLCSYRGKLASNLKKHMLTHSDDKPFACHLCDYRGKLACSLKDHVMLVHSDDRPFACDMCEFKAKVPSQLKKHMVSHQEEAPYQCTMCDFKAKRAGNLKEHMGTHTNEKRYTCSMCSYGTGRLRNLRKHMAIHFDDKPYVCQLCPYRAKLPHYLKDHMKTHDAVKPYACPLCDYKSRQTRQLKRHIQTHTESFGVNNMELAELSNLNKDS